ncbi:dynein axonemal assembly factor 3 [Oratosquilla oratoria]|uniref:dynein axonemal assembly factor 3 n=1 Tax=Oratosquilla oratoria TaxID=337810 RepID=UPI003F772835
MAKISGYGQMNWWGFSPAVDLQDYVKGGGESDQDEGTTKEVRLLLIGAGDPRHILLTLARRHRHKRTRLQIFVLEPHVENYCRLVLLLGAALQHGLGLMKRSHLVLDLWANLKIRSVCEGYLINAARQYSRLTLACSLCVTIHKFSRFFFFFCFYKIFDHVHLMCFSCFISIQVHFFNVISIYTEVTNRSVL